MSEQAQGETKGHLGELALVRGHASTLSLLRQQENGARPAQKTWSSSCRRHLLGRVDDFIQQPWGQSFFVVITVSVDGKQAWSVMSVGFDEALGRCDVRTNTVVSVLRLRLGTPRRCCISRILSCNRLVHALRLAVSCATSLSLSVWIVLTTTKASCCNGRETFFETVCLSFPFSLQSNFIERNLSGQSLWLWSTFFF